MQQKQEKTKISGQETKNRINSAFKNWFGKYISINTEELSTNKANQTSSDRIKFIIKSLLTTVMALMFGLCTTVMGARPLGFAVMMGSWGGTFPFTYIGLVISSLVLPQNNFPAYKGAALIIYTLLFFGRFAMSKLISSNKMIKNFSEPLFLRSAFAAAAAFAYGTVIVIGEGFLWYDMFSAIFSTAAAAAATVLFGSALSPPAKIDAESSGDSVINNVIYGALFRGAGFCSIAFCIVLSLREYTPFGFSLSAIAAFIISVYVSHEAGLLRGGLIGLICGLACGITQAPVFALAAIAAGLFWKISSGAAVIAATICGMAFGVCLDGFSSLRTFAPDLIAASVIFLPAVQFGLLPRLTILSKPAIVPPDSIDNTIIAEKQQKKLVLRLEALSSATAALSEVFYTLSDRLRRPGIYEIRQLVNKVYSDRCAGCAMNSICWNREYSATLGVTDKLARTLNKKGTVTREDVTDEEMRGRCLTLDKLLAELNLFYSELVEKTVRTDKTEIFALDYEAMSKLLEQAAEDRGEYNVNEDLSQKVRETAKYMDFGAASMNVYGDRRKTVIAGGVDLARVKMTANELKDSFGNVCGLPLTSPQFSVDSDYITMVLTSARQMKTEYAYASDKKQGEQINGDSVTIFENKEDYFYVMLSDGMGSGHEAALTSRITGIFIEKMLSAGVSKAIALEMLNNFIRCRNTECFATVDLLEIDLLSGKAAFIKSGAAPSYILREGSLFKIASNTMPVGITREINAEEIRFELEEDDVVILVSDGVAQSFEDGIWLTELVSFDWTDDLNVMAEKILEEAKKNNQRSDDMTVALTRICPAYL